MKTKTTQNSGENKASGLALNFNPSSIKPLNNDGSQTNFMASQTLDLGALGNLNDLSSLNENGTANPGLSSFSAIENLLMVEDCSALSK